MFKLGFLSFLVGFILVGAACTSSKPAVRPSVRSPQPSTQGNAIMSPDVSNADEELPLSSETDVDSLQKDLDNTDLSPVNSADTQIQAELNK